MRKIRKRCACGCGGITKPGNVYIYQHHAFGNTNRKGAKHSAGARRKISLARKGKKLSEEHKKKISLAGMGKKHSEETKRKISLAHQGKKFSAESKRKMSLAKQNQSKETKLKISLSKLRRNPNEKYCNIWRDIEYRNDLRKDYCENVECKKRSKRFCNHHINLDKKCCHPENIMTLCNSCHASLHLRLLRQENGIATAIPKDFIVINRPDHVSYIHKESREIIMINRKKEEG